MKLIIKTMNVTWDNNFHYLKTTAEDEEDEEEKEDAEGLQPISVTDRLLVKCFLLTM